jgi:hypothetical protein
MVFLSITAMVRRVMFLFARISILGVVGLRCWNRSYASGGSFNQFIEFTPIKPNAPALRTVVNFNALTFGHQEV